MSLMASYTATKLLFFGSASRMSSAADIANLINKLLRLNSRIDSANDTPERFLLGQDPCFQAVSMLRCNQMFAQTTIKDVARAAGVHFTTVSMALRDHPAIAARTRTRIQNIAKLVGYQRNEVFFALSQQRKSQHKPRDIPTILYLFRGGSSREFFEMSHHRQFLAGASEEAKKLGYQLDPHLVGPTGILPERLQKHLLRTRAAGVVIGAWDPTLEAPVVDWTPLPTVKIDSRHVLADVPVVSFDQMNGVITSYRKAHSLGYRRIGLALGEKDEDATDGLHLSGWLIAQSEFPRLDKIPPFVFPITRHDHGDFAFSRSLDSTTSRRRDPVQLALGRPNVGSTEGPRRY